MRKVRFTEEQIKGILGEDFASYLPNYSQSSEEPADSDNLEIGVSSKIDGIRTNPMTSDKFGDEHKFGSSSLFRRCHRNTMYESKKKLNEANQDLKGKVLNIPVTILNSLKSAMSSCNGSETAYKRLNNLVQSASVTTDDAYRILDDYKNTSYSKNSVIPKSFINWLKQQLNNMTSLSYMHKDVKRQLGDNNAFQKEGGTKMSGNGNAHTQKNDVTFNYFQ